LNLTANTPFPKITLKNITTEVIEKLSSLYIQKSSSGYDKILMISSDSYILPPYAIYLIRQSQLANSLHI
jgi:hypothetical protein